MWHFVYIDHLTFYWYFKFSCKSGSCLMLAIQVSLSFLSVWMSVFLNIFSLFATLCLVTSVYKRFSLEVGAKWGCIVPQSNFRCCYAPPPPLLYSRCSQGHHLLIFSPLENSYFIDNKPWLSMLQVSQLLLWLDQIFNNQYRNTHHCFSARCIYLFCLVD